VSTSLAARLHGLVEELGGRFSIELGLNLDRRRRDIDSWQLACTLMGARISTTIALQTYRVLADAGLDTLESAGNSPRARLIKLLDQGGYARYDERTADRLRALGPAALRAFPRGVDAWGRRCTTTDDLYSTLDGLPGWGPVTIRAFLRELRGTWPAVDLPLDPRAIAGGEDLGLGSLNWGRLERAADAGGVDPRDAEAALIRCTLR
jgi:hypothetical protein